MCEDEMGSGKVKNLIHSNPLFPNKETEAQDYFLYNYPNCYIAIGNPA